MMPGIGTRFAFLLATLSPSAVQAGIPPPPPPYEGVYQPQGVDEIGLWRVSDEAERALNNSPIVIRDEELNAYLKGVLCETVGPDRCGNVRIYVLRKPDVNASMTPNGTMRVHSGFLLRVRSEAELAVILGHEFAHFEKRHGLNNFKSQRSRTDLLGWAGVLASMSRSDQAHSSYRNWDLPSRVFFRFGRDQEREADRLGLSYLNNSKLRPQAASEVWLNRIGEQEASAKARGLKKPRFDRILDYTASHPPYAERALYLSDMATPEGAMRDDGTDRYRAALAKWIPEFLADQIRLNDFGTGEYIIAALAEKGWTADLWFARGELFRLRGNQRDLVNAADFFREAIAMRPEMADAYRGLGLSLIKTGQRTEAKAALAQYLVLKPDASDARMIGMMIPQEKTE